MRTFKNLIGGTMVLAASFLCANSAMADWKLVEGSSNLSYGTIKNSMIGENNTFKKVSGSLNDDGHIDITIDLSSVDTQIELRDQRMRDIVFKVAENASAKLTGDMNLQAHNDQEIGTSKMVEATIGLELVGEKIEHDVTLMVTRLAENKVLVTPHGVMFIDVDDYNLVSAIETLRGLAGLDSIATVVPMSFNLTFEK
ncbi:YceI family protein [Pseudemcibacter aquimaris]|uniref:YceI family protein n=1 Tax=Pseudemcibacter aquimaris TaxID=2857064 RepID=UPI002012DB44|nr:YceI family protein [Pseudemcibacter aquimaris]MCC3862019.1 YceI family protein [Pseudemcibacter aquimaris]WDU58771.1 YceI family protein [Pseudemcibacter aquimaris]